MKFPCLNGPLDELAVDHRLLEQAGVENGDNIFGRDHRVSAQVNEHTRVLGQRTLPEADLFHNILSHAPVEFLDVPGALRREILRPGSGFGIDEQRSASQSLDTCVGSDLLTCNLRPQLFNERGVRGPLQTERLGR